ncbi:hypothetical protein A8709_08595 [Paenibacillus pectinilyticus]|uniref:Sodium:melibiose symporter n=1 Tax=Paenibacillus pectinilyticus TaxID=512399 RepID=A0A1C1A8C7_9BACL|nr:hypothetical protein A8709_08595 [Paenibacillus pectinilyticus]
MEQKKYLTFGNKMAYGSGDLANNIIFGLITSFLMIYLTDAVGLNAGIIGTLMMFSRFAGGVSDVVAGTIIDRTKHKWGKARPWVFWTIIPVVVCEVLMFSTPSMNTTLQYIYFFIIYTILNDVFFTLNNVAYSTLSVLITANKQERVQLGVVRFVFALVAVSAISGGTMASVNAFGGGVVGWRMTALIFSVIAAVFYYICALSIKELPPSELGIHEDVAPEKTGVFQNLGKLLRNKYYVMQLFINILFNGLMTMVGAVGVYYMKYVIGNAAMLGVFSIVQVVPMFLGLIFTPMLVKRWGIYKVNLIGFTLATIACIPFMIFGMKGMTTPMLISHGFVWLFRAPMLGTTSALTAEISGYTYRQTGKRLDGSMFSCMSMGAKVGAGIATAMTGWLLALSKYDGKLDVQPQSSHSMITFMYVALPLIINVIMVAILMLQKVEKANETWDAHQITAK